MKEVPVYMVEGTIFLFCFLFSCFNLWIKERLGDDSKAKERGAATG